MSNRDTGNAPQSTHWLVFFALQYTEHVLCHDVVIKAKKLIDALFNPRPHHHEVALA